jgi:hydrogenase expression/formation protein HypC
MCLAVPGQLISIEPNDLGVATGRVSFSGIVKDVCLAYTPEAKIGDYVLVHVGFALQTIDEKEAKAVFDFLEEMGETEELMATQRAVGRPE